MMRHDTLTYLRFILNICWIPYPQHHVIILSIELARRKIKIKIMYFSLTCRNVLSDDITNSGSFGPHRYFEFLCFLFLSFNRSVNLLFLSNQIICWFFSLDYQKKIHIRWCMLTTHIPFSWSIFAFEFRWLFFAWCLYRNPLEEWHQFEDWIARKMKITKKKKKKKKKTMAITNSLFTHSVYIAITSSINSTDPPRFLWDSLISEAFPPLLSIKWSISSVMLEESGRA